MSARKGSKTSKTGERGRRAQNTHRAAEDDRHDQRVPIQLLVDYKSEGNYLFDFCKDLGAGGVFIQTSSPLPTGSRIELTFTIPDSKQTINTHGHVIWVQQPIEGRKDLSPGMGVQFAGFSSEQRQLLDEFVQRYHGERLETEAVPSARKHAG